MLIKPEQYTLVHMKTQQPLSSPILLANLLDISKLSEQRPAGGIVRADLALKENLSSRIMLAGSLDDILQDKVFFFF